MADRPRLGIPFVLITAPLTASAALALKAWKDAFIAPPQSVAHHLKALGG